MDKEKLRTINKVQVTSLALTVILTFVPTVGHNNYGQFFGAPIQSLAYYGGGMSGISLNMWSVLVNFIIIYYLCKIGLKVWMSITKRQ